MGRVAWWQREPHTVLRRHMDTRMHAPPFGANANGLPLPAVLTGSTSVQARFIKAVLPTP